MGIDSLAALRNSLPICAASLLILFVSWKESLKVESLEWNNCQSAFLRINLGMNFVLCVEKLLVMKIGMWSPVGGVSKQYQLS